MEPAKGKIDICYVIYTEVAELKQLPSGWFVHFEGSHESIFLSEEKPDLTVGDKVKITIQKVP